MARVPLLEEHEVSPAVRALYEAQRRAQGRVLTTSKARAHCPEILEGVSAMQGAIQRAERVPAPIKVLCTQLVSTLNGCPH